MADVQKVTKAFLFAANKHAAQRKKTGNHDPYISHPAEVADLLARHTGGEDTDLICAGLLHDTLEDTDTTYDELVREFGKKVADIVQECTDDKSLPKAERKRLQVETAPHKSESARMVKIADKISNLPSIVGIDLPDWNLARKQEYFAWAKSVVDGCRGVNPGLEAAFDEAYKAGAKTLGIDNARPAAQARLKFPGVALS